MNAYGYGNGLVGAYNRKDKGRMLKSGPRRAGERREALAPSWQPPVHARQANRSPSLCRLDATEAFCLYGSDSLCSVDAPSSLTHSVQATKSSNPWQDVSLWLLQSSYAITIVACQTV